MDLRLFENSPHIASLLVRLYDSQRLYGLARETSPETRGELSGVMANLLEHALPEREQELVADVLIALIRQAETELRQALAERLARMDNVPLRLVLHLVNDEIQVAGPMLQHSSVLSDLDLVYIIKSQGAPYWRAIAARETLNESIIDMLADTKDADTALVLTANDRVRLTPYALDILTAIAEDRIELARPLLMREEMPPSLARKLYGHVGQELKNYIKAFYGVVPADLENAADEIVLDFVDAIESDPEPVPDYEFIPNDQIMAVAAREFTTGRVDMSGIMDTLKKGNIRIFIAMFSVYTAVPPARVHAMLKQICGRKLAILCRAYSLSKSDFTSMYLLTHRMRSTDRLVNHKDLLMALTYFDRIRPESARLVLARSSTVRH
jgi:uncharacterized protein (DUF2336 family)